ncbi:chaperone protein HtpG [Planctomycetales bacterium]|nr:chaperone protein HtpG [Planctomycetales bacterium]GHT04818.1 chaperone protein HtpG [Planctomycetales bacterium]
MSAEKMEFKAELKQVMEIIVHSLYSHKEIFLRELISNAADAIGKIRFDALTDAELAEGDTDFQIKIIPDAAAKTLTISDNGCGMSRETLINDLGTIARSGTKAFLEKMKQAKSENVDLIGQFGVGFYSAFMVADKVEVVTRAPRQTAATKWTSAGEDSFTVEAAERDQRGTTIVLHLRDDESEFAETWRLRSLVQKFSDFIEYPVVLVTDEKKRDKDGKETDEIEHKEDIVNSRQAIWLRAKSEVKDEEYAEFYKHISHDFDAPLKTIPYAAEGAQEFKALMFVPARRPSDFFMREQRRGLQLYVNRVFIAEECDKLLPPYFSFVRGVVDSSDLPLNVSREMLQEDRQLHKIRKALVSRLFATFKEMLEKEHATYLKFWEQFGVMLKSGLMGDFENRESILDLLLYPSTRASEENKLVTLAQYVEAMPAGQEEIYYMIAENRPMVENSPYMEYFRERGYEVLIMTDPVDETVVAATPEYQGKKLKAIDRGELAAKDETPAAEKEQREKDHRDLLAFIKETLGDEIAETRLSARLKSSPLCLIGEEGQIGAQMERLLRELGQAAPERKLVLEINPDHAAIAALRSKLSADKNAATEDLRLLFDGAVIASGGKIKDPAAFLQRAAKLVAGA